MIERIARMFALVVLLASCTRHEQGGIVGKWQTDSEKPHRRGITLEFAKGGAFTSSGPAGTIRGRYQVERDGMVRMDFGPQSAGDYGLFATSVSNGRLTMCQVRYQCERFTRTN